MSTAENTSDSSFDRQNSRRRTDQVGGVAARRPDQLEPPYDLRLVVQLAGNMSSMSLKPTTAVMALLKSCAMPLAISPRARRRLCCCTDLLLAQLELDELPLEPRIRSATRSRAWSWSASSGLLAKSSAPARIASR